ncbi:Cytochrome c2 [Azospirillaceae bacterium]
MSKLSKVGFGLAIGLTLAAMSGSAFAQDAAAGEKSFKKYCGMCHTTEAGKNRVGPSLNGVVGRTSGSVAGFAYSVANKNSGITWTEDKLDAYLSGPATATVPGTKMTFGGIKDTAERANVIAYLKTQK